MSQRPILHTKDAGGDDTQAFHPEVQAEVLAQVKTMAGNVKGISDKLTSDFAALQETVKTYKDGMDGLVESKITKLTEAIVTRQEALDKLAAEQKSRIDQLDLAFQRQGRFGAPGQDEAKLLIPWFADRERYADQQGSRGQRDRRRGHMTISRSQGVQAGRSTSRLPRSDKYLRKKRG